MPDNDDREPDPERRPMPAGPLYLLVAALLGSLFIILLIFAATVAQGA